MLASAERPAEVASALRGRIDRELASVLDAGAAVALVNYPNIGNLGDAAIWLGARAALDRRGVEIAYECEPAAYRRASLARAIGERGTILLQGGGNLGDLYPGGQQAVREAVLRDFRRARVIQLPQSVWFRRRRPRERFARLAAAHPDFTLVVRERASLARARDELGIDARLWPDLAFALGPLPRPAPPRTEIFWLARTGAERRHDAPRPAAGLAVGDYPTGREQRRGGGGRRMAVALAANRSITWAVRRSPLAGRALRGPQDALYHAIARRRVELAASFASRGEVLVTDRYHGHALALLMGIPTVLLDNSYGKNRALFEAWTHRFAIARWAETPAEALRVARELAAHE